MRHEHATHKYTHTHTHTDTDTDVLTSPEVICIYMTAYTYDLKMSYQRKPYVHTHIPIHGDTQTLTCSHATPCSHTLTH